MRRIDPLTWRQDETVETRPVSKPLEFEGFKIGVVEPLPDAQELDGIAVSHPVLDDKVRSIGLLVFGDVGQGNIIIAGLADHRDGGAFDVDGVFFGSAHGCSYGANWFRDT
jgi:hypothetical protein